MRDVKELENDFENNVNVYVSSDSAKYQNKHLSVVRNLTNGKINVNFVARQ